MSFFVGVCVCVCVVYGENVSALYNFSSRFIKEAVGVVDSPEHDIEN
jgi:hypothetical protein